MAKKIADSFLGGTMYAPFCRTLCVDVSQWPQDFANMKCLGFNCVHGFSEWHDVEAQEGIFDFSKIDAMVHCAAENDIIPIINIATANSVGYYSPRWLMEKCQGGEYVDSAGGKTQDSLYTTPCLDHPVYEQYAERYLNELAKHFAGDARIGGFVIWGEPALFRAGSNDLLCYCEHTVNRFRKWLENKYHTIDALNAAWSTEGPSDFTDFAAVKPPRGYSRQLGGYASWADWRSFLCSNFCSHIRKVDRILKENGADQPTIVELNYNFSGDWYCDPWQVGSCGDIIGVSSFQRPDRSASRVMWAAESIAKAQGKSVFVVECRGGAVAFAKTPSVPSYEEVQSVMLQRAANGASGAMYWCYRPRMSDTEGGDFGMVLKSGRVTYRAEAGGAMTRALAENSAFLQKLQRKSQVAIYTSYEINNLMNADAMADVYREDYQGAQTLLEDLHINGDYINEMYIHRLSQYKVLILPCSYILNPETVAAISRFVQNGGILIADYLVGSKKPDGICYYDMRDNGLEPVLGIEDMDIAMAYGQETISAVGIESGKMYCVPYLTSASCLAQRNGTPVWTENRFGKGTGYYFAAPVFGAYGASGCLEIRKTLKQILHSAGVSGEITLEHSDKQEKSVLLTTQLDGDAGERFYTVLNTADACAEDRLILPPGQYCDIFGEPLQGNAFAISLKPKETLTFLKK